MRPKRLKCAPLVRSSREIGKLTRSAASAKFAMPGTTADATPSHFRCWCDIMNWIAGCWGDAFHKKGIRRCPKIKKTSVIAAVRLDELKLRSGRPNASLHLR